MDKTITVGSKDWDDLGMTFETINYCVVVAEPSDAIDIVALDDILDDADDLREALAAEERFADGQMIGLERYQDYRARRVGGL